MGVFVLIPKGQVQEGRHLLWITVREFMNKFQSVEDNSTLSVLSLLGVHNPILTDDTAKRVGRTNKELCDRKEQQLGEGKHK